MFIHRNTEDALRSIEALLKEVEQSMTIHGRSNPKSLDIDLLAIGVRLQLYLTVETGEPCKEVEELKSRFEEWGAE